MAKSSYKQYEDVKAPDAIKLAKVKAGDRGVVIEEFKDPKPAIMVEYADGDGQTKALVIYSPDLSETYHVDNWLAA